MKIPVDIALHKKSRELELVYEDGPVRLSFEYLRVLSPSAEVQGHSPDEAVLQVGKRLVDITGVQVVGNYAIQFTFSDGHDSGIYSWDYLEKLVNERDVLWQQYLDDLAKNGSSREPNDPANKPFEEKAAKLKRTPLLPFLTTTAKNAEQQQGRGLQTGGSPSDRFRLPDGR